jgi:hypothetical protein
MRGLGDFQRMQMRRTDPVVIELFGHIRAAKGLAYSYICGGTHCPRRKSWCN